MASDLNAILQYSLKKINPFLLLKSVLQTGNGTSIYVQGREYKLRHNVKLIAAGKAVGGMVRAVQDLIGDHILRGVVSLPIGYRDTFYNKKDLYPLPSPLIDIYEGGKDNLPDENSLIAAQAIYQLAQAATLDELVIVLLSGGASTLTSLPPSAISIDEKRFVCSSLSQRGSSINELNTVRKHLSLLKGGKLARLCRPAEVLTLILSDVIGDPLGIIASGPCFPDSSTPTECLAIMNKYELFELMPKPLVDIILRLCTENTAPQLVPSVPCQHVIVGNNKIALEASKECAEKLGYTSSVWSDRVSGSVVELASFYSAVILTQVLKMYTGGCEASGRVMDRCLQLLGVSCVKDSEILAPLYQSYRQVMSSGMCERVCLLSGGEPVVVVRGDGRGGRNQELVLRVGINLDLIYDNLICVLDETVPLEKFQTFWQSISIKFASVGTDGQDGPTPAAGAMVSQHFMRENEKNRDFIRSSLLRNDSYNLFMSLDTSYLVCTDLTATNVMDIHLILISLY